MTASEAVNNPETAAALWRIQRAMDAERHVHGMPICLVPA
jgi:hypothetical protein